jgi:hypothetical protein
MTLSEIITAVSAADLEKPAVRCIRLFDLSPDFFALLRQECVDLLRTERPSEVANRSHVTHWTKPRGTVLQFSLLNRTGHFNDTSSDHDMSCLNKRFHAADRYPNLGALISAFPHSINFRMNVLSPGAALSPHREPVCFRARNGEIGLRLRLHLPIVTNAAAEVVLDDQVFVFEEGQIALFNQGCVHSAMNGGGTDRLHLVWDMLLTQKAAQLLFGNEPPPFPAARYSAVEQMLPPKTLKPARGFVGLAPLVGPSGVARAGVIEPQ